MAEEPRREISTEILARMLAGITKITKHADQHPKARETGSAVCNFFTAELAALCVHLGLDSKEVLVMSRDLLEGVDPFRRKERQQANLDQGVLI